MKPAPKHVHTRLRNIRHIVQTNKQATAGNLIAQLNPVMRGWANYHRHVVSKAIFSKVDTAIFHTLWSYPIIMERGAGIASAVVTNWVYCNARESALLAIVYHTAANTMGGFYFFPMFSGPDSVRLWWLYAAVYCVAAVVVVLAAGANLQHQPQAQTV